MLPNYPNLLLFLSAVLILNLIPGADVLYVASQSVVNKRQGILAAFGISTGIGIYILATAFGLAAILHHSYLAFNLIKLIGAIYLIYLAWQLFSKQQIIDVSINNKEIVGLQAYYKGTLTTLLNPKVGLFFLTFLPQFTDAHRGKIWLQLLSLGVCFIISGTLVNLMYVYLFGYLKQHVFSKTHIQKLFNKVTALLFCVLAIKVLVTRQN